MTSKCMIEIIPAINSEIFEDVQKKIQRVHGYTRWIHLDVANGTFTKNVLWHDSEDLKKLEIGNLKIEVHLMIENPEAVVDRWVKAGAKRIIVHAETIKNFALLKQTCDAGNAALMISIAPDTSVHALGPYFSKNIDFYQVLAVHPGLPGQLFIESSYDKIRYIREKCPHCNIEVDGGINVGVARRCKDAGADIFVAASAVFNAETVEKGVANILDDIVN